MTSPENDNDLEPADLERIFRIARDEMVGHVSRGPSRIPSSLIKTFAEIAFYAPARSLARHLTAFDHDLSRYRSIRIASLRMLDRYAVRARVTHVSSGASMSPQHLAKHGPLLVVSNHPGLYDALALFAAIGRDDIAVLAADRGLLAALPHMQRHLIVSPSDARAGFSLRRAARHLQQGGALLHFPAGQIEPDPRLLGPHENPLLPWKPGLEPLIALAARPRPDLRVIPAIVSGVVSKRARAVSRLLAGRAGLTDALVPLLQLTLPGFHDIDVCVRFGAEIAAHDKNILDTQRVTATLRSSLTRLAKLAGRSP